MIDERFARSLLSEFGSPIYAYDAEEYERRVETLFAALPSGSRLYYSLKANPLPSLAAIARKKGCGAEISSAGELQASIEAGFAPFEMLYSGPGKTLVEIREALDAGVTHFSCESWVDLERLETAAGERRLEINVLLRVNPSGAQKSQLAMSGVASQFGFEEDDLATGARRLLSLRHVDVMGFHVYYGTQAGGPEAIAATAEVAFQTANRLARELRLTPRVLDLGGGFPWPYAVKSEQPHLTGLRDALNERYFQNASAGGQPELWFESGRYLSASCGTLLSTVLDVKESKGRKFVVLDAGINHLGGMPGLGRIPRPVVSLERVGETADGTEDGSLDVVDVSGPLCSPLDIVGRNISAPRLGVGDVVSVPNVGAYGLTASLLHFLSRPPATEVLYKGTQVLGAYQLRSGHEKLTHKEVQWT